ncbi:predicted protein [Nematostella vectensis]|uniref:Uncharacterized protein n=1 Tax=Nematostella vectensis TaxID=45351 RepID=A7S7T7_NEMVE|nr:predicted protein [Nematostella vectensis]|eukprot:XP_001632312.1 predicted protein [Nematostella vectensis]
MGLKMADSHVQKIRDLLSSKAPLITFGTYNYKHHEILEDSVSQAMYLFAHNGLTQVIDSAMKYHNLPSILKILEQHPNAMVGWKVEHTARAKVKKSHGGAQPSQGVSFDNAVPGNNMQDGLAILKSRVPQSKVFRILMHNYCGKKSYLGFQQLNEYHPFLETTVPEVCSKYGIRFESHSVLTNLEGYSECFSKLGVNQGVTVPKVAGLALKYAEKKGDVCFATTNFSHLRQNLEALTSTKVNGEDAALFSAMEEFHTLKRIARYKGSETGINADWIKACKLDQIRNEILPRLKKDIAAFEAGRLPSNLCITIPKSYRPGGKVHAIIAEMLYGQDLEDQMNELKSKLERKQGEVEGGQLSKVTDEDVKTRLVAKWNCTLDVTLTKMRRTINKAVTEKRIKSKKAAQPIKAVENPEALPMDEYPEAEEFEDFIEFLKCGGTVDQETSKGNNVNGLPANIRFKHGTINSDGRLDMCKQGFRNAFVDTCDAVIKDGQTLPVNVRFKYGTLNSDGRLDMCKQGFRNAFIKTCDAVVQDADQGTKTPLIKHYLIGNNRIAENGDTPGEGGRRVAALARMIMHRPDIETWFLAGNSMGPDHISLIADALKQTKAKYVWLKMNPVKTGAYHLGKMLVLAPSVELLDLFNTGLCNDGLKAFAKGLSDGAAVGPSSASNLRHLYLSINAISSVQVFESMLSFLPQLESLFMGVNPIGDEGLERLADVLTNKAPCRSTLKRLNIDALALTDKSLPLIEDIVKACPSLVALDLGSYKSTNYFNQKHNRFDVENESTIGHLEKIARALVRNAEMSKDGREEKDLPMHYLGLQHSLVVGINPDDRTLSLSEAAKIINDVTKNRLHYGTGINLNGITNLYTPRNGTPYCHTGEWEAQRYQGGADGPSCCLRREGSVKSGCTEVVYPSNRAACGGLFYAEGVTNDDLRKNARHPWPAVDHIKSIYRNTMKK